MTRRKFVILCVVGLALACGVVLIVSDPSFWIRKGMTYGEVEAILGKEHHGMRPVSVDDGSWTGLWPGPIGTIEVTFDSRNRVRESPSFARRVLAWIGSWGVLSEYQPRRTSGLTGFVDGRAVPSGVGREPWVEKQEGEHPEAGRLAFFRGLEP
jgi:hypothetical protein